MASGQYGNYKLVELLDGGGEAEVWKAISTNGTSTEFVALRILKQCKNTDDIQRRFVREVTKHQSLNQYPHIIPLQDFNWNQGKPYLVMPYIPSGSLGDALKKGKWPPFKDSLTYLEQMAEALGYAHEKGIIHRDVKPANLLLGSEGILLSDFGLALDAAAPPPHTRGSWGSDYYRPPEQKDGNPPDPANDQYALAVTMCQLFTRMYPKKDEKKKENEYGKEELEKHFPKTAKVFMKAWDNDPKKRFSSITEFAHEFNQKALSDLSDIAAQAIFSDSDSLENNDSDQKKHDAKTHKSSQQESLDRNNHSQESHYLDLHNDNQPVQRKKSGPAFFWGKVIFLFLTLLLVTILIIDDLRLRLLLNNTPTIPNLLTVTTLSDNISGSLRQEIATVQKGNRATITFASSLQGSVELTQDLEIPADVSIEAPVVHKITITPQKPTIRIHIPQGKNTSFVNIDFQGGKQVGKQAFIVNEGTLHITNSLTSQFQSNSSVFSNLNGGSLTFTQSEITGNQSSEGDGGAISNVNGTVTLDNSKIRDNQANYNGGGIYSMNGHVFIQNQSSITNNQVLHSPSGSDPAGGGGIAILGGSVSISDSVIESNISKGNGGGILLIGTNAQIDHSVIQFNQTNTTQAGGIAVETNPENNYSSFLILTNNTLVQHNSNSSADLAVDIEGKVVSKGSASISINSKPLKEIPRPPSDPTSFDQFLGYLTLENFQKYCQSQQNSQKQPFTDASLSADGQTITCKSNNGETLSLSTKNNKVNEVCTMLNADAKFPLARLFRYLDSSTWQCFRDEHSLSLITKPIPPTNKVPLASYCTDIGGYIVPSPQENNPATAYDWQCKQGTNRLSLTMDVACQKVTRNSLALARLVDYNDPYSWECWGPDNAKN